jgi:prolipoprotein diacylglyceryltransferase
MIIVPGILFSIYLILNGVERFLIEFIRVNIQYSFLGMNITQAQLIAIGLITLGVLGIVYFRYQYKKSKKTT